MHCHCGTNNRAPRWTFTDPCKPEVRPGALDLELKCRIICCVYNTDCKIIFESYTFKDITGLWMLSVNWIRTFYIIIRIQYQIMQMCFVVFVAHIILLFDLPLWSIYIKSIVIYCFKEDTFHDMSHLLTYFVILTLHLGSVQYRKMDTISTDD